MTFTLSKAVLVSLCLLAVLVGCASVTSVRETIDLFNEASTEYNEYELFTQSESEYVANFNPEQAALGLDVIMLKYAAVVTMINELEKNNKPALEADGLLKNLRVMKVFSLMKMGRFLEANEEAQRFQSLSQTPQQVISRDDVVIAMLPSLVAIDEAQALRKTTLTQAKSAYSVQEIRAWNRMKNALYPTSDALQNIAAGVREPGLKSYIASSEAIAMNNLFRAYAGLKVCGTIELTDKTACEARMMDISDRKKAAYTKLVESMLQTLGSCENVKNNVAMQKYVAALGPDIPHACYGVR